MWANPESTAPFVAGLSLFGSSCIVLTYLCFPSLQLLPFRLVLWLALADALVSTSLLLSQVDSEGMCMFAGGLRFFSKLASALCTGCLAFLLYRMVSFESGRGLLVKEWWFLVVIWLLPAIASVPFVALHSFAKDSTAWCWVDDKHRSRHLILAVPFMIIFCVNVTLFTLTIHHLLHKPRSRQSWLNESLTSPSRDLTVARVVHRTLLYVVVYIVVRLAESVDSLRGLGVDDTRVTGWTRIHVLAEGLQGFIDALVYGSTRRVVGSWLAPCSGSARPRSELSVV